ncbi:MAG: metal-sulfur cluster assembly factor [Candidatus Woesearchaeota archaeon]
MGGLSQDNNHEEINQIRDKVVDVLKRVDDPELGLDVYTLGLIYKLDIKENKKTSKLEKSNKTKEKNSFNKYRVEITMTFTTPLCPYGPMLMDLIESAIKEEVKEIDTVKIEITFEPPWQPSEELKTALGLN